MVTLVLLIVINLGLILPEKLQLRQYHVTELIPMPSLRPEPEPDQGGKAGDSSQAAARGEAAGI